MTLTYLGSRDCTRPTVQLYEQPPVNLGDIGTVATGTYATYDLCPLSPGDSVELRVELFTGETVRGMTVIPGARSMDVRTRGERGEYLTLWHDHDSIWIDVEPISARALDVELSRDPERSPDSY